MIKFFGIAVTVLAAGVVFTVGCSRPSASPQVGSEELDAQVFRALRDAGADLTKETEVNFYLYFPIRDSAVRAAESDHIAGFQAMVKPGADDKTWLCLISGRMVPTEAAIRTAGVRLTALATSLNGRYDGWEAAVTK